MFLRNLVPFDHSPVSRFRRARKAARRSILKRLIIPCPTHCLSVRKGDPYESAFWRPQVAQPVTERQDPDFRQTLKESFAWF